MTCGCHSNSSLPVVNAVKTQTKPFVISLRVLMLALPLIAQTTQAHVISEEDHHAFEHKFAEMCVEKEKQAMKGSGVLLSEVQAVCDCIAREESKRITIEEVRKFVKEGKYPASLMMKSNAATYACVPKPSN